MASPTEDPPPPPLPEEILEAIFICLDEAADLARASAACTSFRRLISEPRFRRRFRSLHRPPILGCLASEFPLFHAVDPPHRSAAASAALAQAADFTFSFINPRDNWQVRDVRDSRVLLSKAYYPPHPFEYLVVCDPLHRRYATIPAIPADLRPSSLERGIRPMEIEPFLDALSEKEKEEEEDLPFRVICNVMCISKFVTLVFSSVTRKWQAAATFDYEYTVSFVRHYAHNCFYWTHLAKSDMLVLDPSEMKFSVVNLPPRSFHSGWWGLDRAIVDVGDDRLGMLTFSSGKRSLELFSVTLRNGGIGTEDWQHDETIPLPNYSRWSMRDAAAGCVLLRCISKDYKQDPETQYFVVDLKKLDVERLCVFKTFSSPTFSYASFPPPLSQPSI